MRNNAEIAERVAVHAGYVVVGPDTLVLKTSMDLTTALNYTNPVLTLTALARSACRDVDPSNDLLVLRIGTRKNEIIACNDKEFSIIAVQKKAKADKLES